MRPHHARTVTITVGLLLLASAILLRSGIGPTGEAIGSFSAGVTVVGVTIDAANASQQQQPATGGGMVGFLFPIAYGGSGAVTVTVAKPSGYEACGSWSVTEDGDAVAVTDTGANLQWTADLDASTVTLSCQAQAPTVTLLDIVANETHENRTILVSADVHFTNVLVQIAIDSTAENATLYEIVNGTPIDTTAQYGFVASGGTATWSGFNLSSREFLIAARVFPHSSPPSFSHRYSSRTQRQSPWFITLQHPLSPDLPEVPFTATPVVQEIDLPGEGATATTTLLLNNTGNGTLTLSLRSTAPFATPSQDTLLLDAGQSVPVTVALVARRTGAQESRIIVTDGAHTQEVFITINVPEVLAPAFAASTLAQAQAEEPSPLRWRSWWTDAVLLLGVGLIGLVVAFTYRGPKKPVASVPLEDIFAPKP